MDASLILENKGFYSQIKKNSGLFMSVKESSLCERVTEAFNSFSSEYETSNRKKNARSSYNTARKYLGNDKRITNGFTPDFEIPHSTFREYLVAELVDGLSRPIINNSDKAMRYTNEFFSTLEGKAIPLIEKAKNVRETKKISCEDSFYELAGYENEFRRIKNTLVTQLTKREELKKLGIKPSKGVILYGPPGTGKTSIARAVSNSAGISFFGFSGSEFLQRYVGDGPEKVRTAVSKAKQNPPGIIFIDEADIIFARRSSIHRQHEDVLAQFLTSIEGIEENDGVAFALSTNRYDMLDDAIISRFRKQDRIEIPLPNFEDRKKILKLKLSNAKHEIKNYGYWSEKSVGWSGRDIDNFVQEVAWSVYEKGKKVITPRDLEEVINEYESFSTT